jgi:hypothetical protein
LSSIRHQHRDYFIAVPPPKSKIRIEGEDLSASVDFSEPDKTCICQGHGPVSIPVHQSSQVGLLVLNGNRDPNNAPFQPRK